MFGNKKPKSKHTKNTFSILNKNSAMSGQFDIAEVFRAIRTSIEYSGTDKDITSISVTSTKAAEAKSTTSMNLAYTFAAKYKKVLIVDCDLRKRTLNKYMALPNDEGLTDAVREFGKTHAYNPSYFHVQEHETFAGNLYVLTAGTKVPNPSEVLGSKAFKDYMAELKKHFDFIIVDCAPAMQTSDPIPVGNAVDATIFVCSAKDTNRKEAAAAVQLLQRNNVNIIGSILTKADTYNNNYYYYY